MDKQDDRFLKVFELKSGFTIGVKPLPPYYMDIVEQAFPLLDPPQREYINIAGDTFYYDYEIPEEPVPEGHEDYDLYMEALYIEEQNDKIKKRRIRAKRDLLLSVCVSIMDGPEQVGEDGWVQEVEAAFPEDFQVPEHLGARRLLFIKSRVITVKDEAHAIQATATYQEVTEQGIASALHGFRDKVGEGASPQSYQSRERKQSS